MSVKRGGKTLEREYTDLIRDMVKGWGGEITQAQMGAFDLYLDELKKWNASLNITAIEGDKDVVVKHIIDSLTPLSYLPASGFLLDIGSGGGFPGLPLKIVRPSLRVLLLDSSHKKIVFLKNVIRKLGLKEVDALAQRAESKAFQDIMQGTADAVISRAVFPMDIFIPIGAPYVKKGGILVSMRGAQGDQEAIESQPYQKKYDLRVERVEEFSLPFDMGKRTLVILRKE